MKEQDFLDYGFEKDDDPMFKFRKELVSSDQVEENCLEFDEVPALLYGSTGINQGFCIYTGEHFVWLNCLTIKEAIYISEKIVAFEPV